VSVMDEEELLREQERLCKAYGAPFVPSPMWLKVGAAANLRAGLVPINGLRHEPTGETTGWYLWAGTEFSEDPGFFLPLHVAHLEQWRPEILRFLGLAPGWRFLVDGSYVDVWQDTELRNV